VRTEFWVQMKPVKSLLLTGIGILISLSVAAGPVGLPDTARPGAVRPETEEEPEKEIAETPPGPQVDSLEIPAVIDRPFDIDEGERIIVQQFRILDVEDLPEFDIRVDEINALLEQQKAQYPDGLTIGRLQEVANVVSDYYRGHGLILTQVIIPVQTVEDGIVDFQVFIGILGRVLAEGNEIYAKEIFEQAFNHLIGKPISKVEITAALLRLTDYPGLTIFGVFQPGQLIGTADIVLKVQEEKRYDVAYRVDNQGTRETGKNRFRTIVDWNNITGGADRLTLAWQQSYNPKNSTYKGLDYERYFAGGWKFGAFINNNEFDVGGEFKENQIESGSDNIGAYVERSLIRSRQRNLLWRAGYTKKKSSTTTAGIDTSEDRISVFSLDFEYDSVDTFSLNPEEGGGGINFLSVQFARGFNDFAGAMGTSVDAALRAPIGRQPSRSSGIDGRFAAGQFSKVFASYTRLQTLKTHQNLLIRAEWHWSDDLLTPLEQYSVGGPDNVRAYPVAQVLWDRAYFLAVEWIFNAPLIADVPAFANRTWGEMLQLSLFYDVATGRINEPLATDFLGYDTYRGAGVGLRFNVPATMDARVMWAWPMGHNDSSATIGKSHRRPQVWGDFTYSF